MGKEGMALDRTTIVVVLKACLGFEDYDLAIQVHGKVVQMGFDLYAVTGSAIVDMYAKCKKLKVSIHFFDEMPEKNWVSWSALIVGCVQNDEYFSGLELFKKMQNERVRVSQSTYASVFRSCAGLSALRFCSQLHGHAVKRNFGSDIIAGTGTLDMYAKCDNLSDAKKLFKLLTNCNLQSHNAIIIGCAREGVQVHGLAIKSSFCSNVCVANAIMDMYGKCGALVEAHGVFDKMERSDAVSWNAIIAAYEQNGKEEETLSLFVWMLRSIEKLANFGAKMVIIGNSSRRASTTMEKLKTLGFDPSLFVGAITSGELTCQHLERLSIIQLKFSICNSLLLEIRGFGLKVVENVEEAEFVLAHRTEGLGRSSCASCPMKVEDLEKILEKYTAKKIPMMVANLDFVTVEARALRVMPGKDIAIS
ncbi:hypothetical protein LguiA_002644 [Lonicera macranthoides]